MFSVLLSNTLQNRQLKLANHHKVSWSNVFLQKEWIGHWPSSMRLVEEGCDRTFSPLLVQDIYLNQWRKYIILHSVPRFNALNDLIETGPTEIHCLDMIYGYKIQSNTCVDLLSQLWRIMNNVMLCVTTFHMPTYCDLYCNRRLLGLICFPLAFM